jgi:hypothetical protein
MPQLWVKKLFGSSEVVAEKYIRASPPPFSFHLPAAVSALGEPAAAHTVHTGAGQRMTKKRCPPNEDDSAALVFLLWKRCCQMAWQTVSMQYEVPSDGAKGAEQLPPSAILQSVAVAVVLHYCLPGAEPTFLATGECRFRTGIAMLP